MLREDGESAPVAPVDGGTTTKDMAQFTPKLGTVSRRNLKKKKRPITEATECFRGIPCFNIEDSAEFHSFAKGLKGFRYWRKHTQSEEIRGWANANYGKSFYVHHDGNYMLINRERKVQESFEAEIPLNELLNFSNKEEFTKSLKVTIKNIQDYYRGNRFDGFYAYCGALQKQLVNGNQYIQDKNLKGFKKWTDDMSILKYADQLNTAIAKGTI